MAQKRGAKRHYDKDGNGRILVDAVGLANMVVRRCEGCTPDEHYTVAERFLEAQGFEDEVRKQVRAVLDKYLQRRRTPHFFVGAATTLCKDCQMPLGHHARDPKVPWLTVLCDGRRVKVQ